MTVAVDGVDIMYGGDPSVTRTVVGAEKDCGHDRLSVVRWTRSAGRRRLSSRMHQAEKSARLGLSREREVVGRDSRDVTMTRRSEDTVLLGIKPDAFPR